MASCAQCSAELPEDARFCSACGTAVEAPRTQERKLATVLFADLVGSTALGEQDPERTRATLERFYEAMAAEVELAGGTLEKFAGDAVMAAFGAPAALEDHAERALHAALAMQRRMAEKFGEDLRLRVGVNTGEVVVGRPREGSSFVTGDAVNVAARLEEAAAPGEIVAGARTVAAARGAFEFAEQQTIEAKGKPGGVECARLIRALSLMRPRGVRGLARAFVGREAELEILQANYRRTVERGGVHFVTLVGEGGVGKTTIIRELWERLGAEAPSPLRRTGRCLAYGQGITYWPLGEILKEHLGLLESDPPEEVQRRLAAREILGLTFGLDVAGDLHPLAARERLHEAWVELLEELAAQRPAVVLVEDLHWAEEPLLDLLERLLREVNGPLLLLGTARPELLDRRPMWGGGQRNASLLWLEPLEQQETLVMVDELLAAPLPEELRRRIAEAAEGNPFFVEEIVGTLIDRGVLERRNGSWRVYELPTGFDVPDTIHAVLAARIDMLPATEKAALQAAAVVGRTFWDGPVRELVGDEPDFALLEERDFVRRRSGSTMQGQREYAIKHALTREVAYDSLPKARRARLHAMLADWLERVGEARDDLAPLLAHHYAHAVRPEDADLAWTGEEQELVRLTERAISWLERASELARVRHDLEGAIALAERAIALDPLPEVRSRLWRSIGIANALRYDGEAFWRAMESSLETCIDRATCADSYSQLAFQTSIRSGMWPRRPNPELVDGWVAQALELAEPETPARVRALLASAVSHIHVDVNEDAAREGAAIAETLGDPELRSWAWATRSATAARHLRFEEAFDWAQRRFELEAEISDPDHLVELREAAVPAAAALGRLKEARRLADEHTAKSQALSPHHRVHAIGLHAEIEETAGEWEAVIALEPKIEAAVAENAATPCIRHQRSLLLCAAARAYHGDRERALELAARADAIPQEGHALALNPVRLRLALALGDLDAVADLTQREPTYLIVWGLGPATSWFDGLAALGDRDRVERDAPPFLRPSLITEPYVQRALGIVRDDGDLLRAAAAGFERRGMHHQASETAKLLR